jgi:hypothetical protein
MTDIPVRAELFIWIFGGIPDRRFAQNKVGHARVAAPV